MDALSYVHNLSISYSPSELRSWLLFYSLPVLLGVLPQPYITHFALLVASVYLLMSENITSHSIQLSRQLPRQFYRQYCDLYGNSTHADVNCCMYYQY